MTDAVFSRAERNGVGVFIALAGTSRTGKTYTALRIARGLAGPNGKIAAIDTEGKRMSHYADTFAFDVANMQPPYDPMRFADMALDAERQGYAALVIDSFSLEWSGTGGVLSRYEERFKQLGSQQKMSDVAWAYAKAPHKVMRDRLLQSTMPIIFCLRANEVSDHLGGGWKVEQDKRFLYEWTLALTLHPDTPGMPRYDMRTPKNKQGHSEPAWKMNEQFLRIFPEGKLIGEDAGRALSAWRNGAEARSPESSSETAKPPVRRTFKDLVESIAKAAEQVSSYEEAVALRDSDDVQLVMTKGSKPVVDEVQKILAGATERFPEPSGFRPAQSTSSDSAEDSWGEPADQEAA
jgi:hypothetical protein